jgi:hypothetical protein
MRRTSSWINIIGTGTAVLMMHSTATLHGQSSPLLLDHVGAVYARLRTICPMAGMSRELLLAEEQRRLDAVSSSGRSDDWEALGCARAALFVHDSTRARFVTPSIAAVISGALQAFGNSLQLEPTRPRAAEAFATIAIEIVGQDYRMTPVVTGATGRIVVPEESLADVIYDAVRSGVVSPVVFRGCVDFMLAVADFASMRYCANRALSAGMDSTWMLLRLAYVDLRHGDTAVMLSDFDHAVWAAHDTASRNELASHVGGGKSFHASFRDSTRWVLAQWAGLGDADRVSWTHRYAIQHVEGDYKTYERIVARHFGMVRYGIISFIVCGSDADLVAQCDDYRLSDYREMGLSARLFRMWDPQDGTPLGIAAYTVRTNSSKTALGVGGSDRAALSLRLWDNVHHTFNTSDSSADAATQGTASVTGILVARSPPAVTSWTFVTTAAGPQRGRVRRDALLPLKSAPTVISDIILGSDGHSATWNHNGRQTLAASSDTVNSRTPVAVYFQVLAAEPHEQVRISLAMYKRDQSSGPPALSVGFDAAVRAGVTEFPREVDFSRLGAGRYQLQIRIMDIAGTFCVTRECTIVLE